ncbi:MAG: DUF5672 family protein [Dysgonomonas sp.]|nr:DUF5672 family protein [Dysgonomonas sp.]
MNAIVIPIYKLKPDKYEEISYLQCLKILKNYPIILVTHEELDIKYYKDLLEEYGLDYKIELFDPLYFSNIVGYNFLMLSKDFYQRVSNYEYILIYQLDCFVFYDNLEFWASTGFDYIGSPWFTHYIDFAEDRPFWYNGNGGFSLRKVQAFIDVLEWKKPLWNSRTIKYNLKQLDLSPIQSFFLYLSQLLGYHNNIDYFFRKQGYDPKIMKTALSDGIKRSNEDVIWSNSFQHTHIRIKTPNFEQGLGFSFERSPRYLYEQNGDQMPFGCHAWAKYDLDFWKPHIEKFGYII